MTGDPRSKEPSPDEETKVRTWLSSVPTEAMPRDVAERLEVSLRAEVAARQQAQPHEAGEPATPRRRVRRWLPAVAVAAIVLGVVAIAVPLLRQESTPDAASPGSSTSQPAPEHDSPRTGASAGSDSGSDSGPDSEPGARRSPRAGARVPSAGTAAGPVRLGTDRFARDVTARVVRPDRSPAPANPGSLDRLACRHGRLATSAGLAVTVDGDPARLFASGPSKAREFRAIGCVGGQPHVAASATLDTSGH